MPSKFDQLREGQAVEIEPGLSGKLNKEKKTLELSTGQVLNVGDNPNFFPRDQKQLALSKQKEYMEKGAKGSGGEFLHQFTTQGVPGGIGDTISYFTQSGEDYANRKAAENQVSQRISEESPYISAGATGANVAADVFLTRGMSALKAAPLLHAASSGSRLITEPGEVLGESALAAGAGGILDKGAGWLGKVSERRAASRALPGQQEAVRAQNLAGQQATAQANAQQTEQFNLLRQNVKNVNEAKLQQHQADLNIRQNKIIQDQNSFEQAKAARDAEVVRLKNAAEMAKMQKSADKARLDSEYKMAKDAAEREDRVFAEKFKVEQKQYEDALKKLPEMQKRAQAEYSANVVKNASEIEKSFPKSSKISTEELGVAQFIDENINKTGIGGSSSSRQATRVLESIFPEGELLGGRELSKRYKALEDAIQRSTPEVQNVLKQFKKNLGNKLPSILEDSIAYSKIVPLLKRGLESDIKAIMSEVNLGKEAGSLARFADTKMRTLLKYEVAPANFVQKLQNGELSRELANKIMTVEDFLVDFTPSNIDFMKKQGTWPIVVKEAEKKHALFVNELTKKLQTRLAKYEIKAMESARNASKKLGKDVKKTYGMAEPVPPPPMPVPPQPVAFPSPPGELPPIPPVQLPPPINAPQVPPMPPKPSLLSPPTQPTPQTFIPQAEPNLAPAQGMADRTGDFLEKNLLAGKGLVDNPVTKLAGLKYLLGSAAVPAEAAYLGMKGLTSPTAAGEVARMSFKQGGIQAIDSWAKKYPSYHNGILENPQDRRSLTKEIEDEPEIPIEQKAVIQSKVNRGKPLQERL